VIVTTTTVAVGTLLKEWRGRRRRSQLDLAYEAGVSPRHLSFVETGRARPSPELLLTLADHLDVPLRVRNSLLLAAGYAPRFRETPLSNPDMERIRDALQHVLDVHDPYPGAVLNRSWDVVLANGAATRLIATLPAPLRDPVNMFRASLHPDGFASATRNFDEWGTYLLNQLHRLVVFTADPELLALETEIRDYATVRDLTAREGWTDGAEASQDPQLLVRCELAVGGVDITLFTTLTTFGTPLDITLDELAVELFYPADDATERFLRR
jgi:transcriptional regulator with XRE-family HTH domain